MKSSLFPYVIAALATLVLATLPGCAVSPDKVTVPVAPAIDLQRFMGPWYVIGVIPTFIEKDAYNAVESYALAADGTIETTFIFNKGALDGPRKQYNPKGFVIPGTNNAVWGMRFVWPIKAEFVISHVDDVYSETIIARSARDYVWIMARRPDLSAKRYEVLLGKVRDMGYDVTRIRKVPHAAVPPQSEVPSITPTALARMLRENDDRSLPLILDVRAPDEFAAGHVPRARNIPHDQLAARLAELGEARDQAIVVYCRSGRRAAIALELLKGGGFSRLATLEGDYPGWQASMAGQQTVW